MRKGPAACILALLLGAVPLRAVLAEESLVLIASANSQVTQLDSLELRKLFLGMTVVHSGSRLRPLINEADPRVKEIFLQNIVSMTDMTYDRRVLRLALQSGRPIPESYTDTAALLEAVAADPTAISFAWARDVQRDRRLKELRVLWHD